jgi:hypothetical protein
MEKSRLQLSLGIVRACSYFLLIAVLANCSGDEGPMGPPGYNGRDGVDGINYTRSAIYDIDPGEWDGNLDGYTTLLDVPEITEDIYYDGAVLVYRLIEEDPISFNMLPYTYVDNALSIYFDYDAYIGSINLIYKEVFDLVNDTPAPGFMSFKIVIIEGIPLATLKTMVDVKDYNAVTKMFPMDGGNNSNVQ